MAETELTSFVGWIDLSEEDQKRARDYLRSLSEGTLDELGFGVIRDSFADLFFPATSTIMTRARYFILVPAIYQSVLDDGLTGKAAERKCLGLEKELRTLFRHNGTLKGTQKEQVQRYPASIYWAGLRRLGIYQRNGSQAHYFAKLKEYLDLSQVMEDDDDNAHAEEGVRDLWDREFVFLYEHGDLPAPNRHGEFPEDADLELTHIEATYLRDKFIRDAGNTIIAHLLGQDDFKDFSYPWQCSYPPELKRAVYHAERFSMLSKLATLVYYQMLIELQGEHEIANAATDMTDAIQLWWDNSAAKIANWNIEDFMTLATEMKSLRGDDAYFIRQFLAAASQSRSATHFLTRDRVHKLIVAREKDKRPQKRRLRPGRFLRDWKLPPSATHSYLSDPYYVRYQLDYRGGIASRIVGDIFEGIDR